MKWSGVEWSGDVPSHWKIERIKELFSETSIKGRADLPSLAATQHAGVIYKKDVGWRNVEASEEGRGSFKMVSPSNFVISLRSFEGGIKHSEVQGIISSAYTVLELSGECEKYYKYFMKSAGFINSLQIHKKGIREGQSISFSAFENDAILVPPLEKPMAISSHIESNVRIADRQINLLERKN